MIIKKIAKKEDFIKLLAKASQDWDVFAPFEDMNGDIAVDKVEADGECLKQKIVLNSGRLLRSFKHILFPQCEKILSFKGDMVEEHLDTRKKMFCGMRSCDVTAMLFTDEFFKRDYEDIYYLTRAKNRFIISIGCNEPSDGCFCAEAGTGPYLKNGFDIQLTSSNGGYYVEVGSDEGKTFIEKYMKCFEDIGEADYKKVKEIHECAMGACKTDLGFEVAVGKLNKGLVPEDELERISKKCIDCGACLYNCPTCTCFDVNDTTDDGVDCRYRSWDGCVFRGYTMEASGHNPRLERKIRAGRRYEHKLKYDYKVNKKSGCVGCGRCLAYCPVELGIEQVIQKVAALP